MRYISYIDTHTFCFMYKILLIYFFDTKTCWLNKVFISILLQSNSFTQEDKRAHLPLLTLTHCVSIMYLNWPHFVNFVTLFASSSTSMQVATWVVLLDSCEFNLLKKALKQPRMNSVYSKRINVGVGVYLIFYWYT